MKTWILTIMGVLLLAVIAAGPMRVAYQKWQDMQAVLRKGDR